MDFLPPSQQQRLLFKNNTHRAAEATVYGGSLVRVNNLAAGALTIYVHEMTF
jgi:hypothetical protein